jgi:hypothetical protein
MSVARLYSVSDGQMMGGLEAVMIKVLSQNLPGGTKDNHGKPQ